MVGRRLLMRGHTWSQSRRRLSDDHRPVQIRRPSFSETDVLHMDNHMLFINKPAGLLSQGDRTGDVDVLALAREYIRVAANKPGEAFAATVHRLDRPVSGVMCVARTSKAAARLCTSFRERDGMEKWYHAIVAGGLSGSGMREDVIVSPTASRNSEAAVKNGRGPRAAVLLEEHRGPNERSGKTPKNDCKRDPLSASAAAGVLSDAEALPAAAAPQGCGGENWDEFQASPPVSCLPNTPTVCGGKRAILQWEAVDLSRASPLSAAGVAPVLRCPCTGDPRTLVRLKLVTGRKHQIRIQLAHMGHPVVGDVRYGRSRRGERGKNGSIRYPSILPLDMRPLEDRSIMLHASELAVPHPTRPGETVRVRASPPRTWLELCGRDVIDQVFGKRGGGGVMRMCFETRF